MDPNISVRLRPPPEAGTGIEDDHITSKYKPDIYIYPNPAKKRFAIKTDSRDYKLDIFNLKGQKVDVSVDKNGVIDNLPSGLYFLKFTINNRQTTKKVIILR